MDEAASGVQGQSRWWGSAGKASKDESFFFGAIAGRLNKPIS